MLEGNVSPYSILGVVGIDTEGNRLFLKYFKNDIVFLTKKEQLNIEKEVKKHSEQEDVGIVLSNGCVCIFQNRFDIIFFVIGSSSSNEFVLQQTLSCICDSFCCLRSELDKQALLKDYELFCFIVDSVIDSGIVICLDIEKIVKKMSFKRDTEGNSKGIGSFFSKAKKTIRKKIIGK